MNNFDNCITFSPVMLENLNLIDRQIEMPVTRQVVDFVENEVLGPTSTAMEFIQTDLDEKAK